MRLHNWIYLVKSGVKSVGSNRLMAFAGVGSLTACFLLMGAAALALTAVNGLAGAVGGQSGMEVLLYGDADADQIHSRLQSMEGVGEVSYFSAGENLLRMCERLDETPESMLERPGEDNPFLASFVVRMEDPEAYEVCLRAIEGLDGVAAVKGSPQTGPLLANLKRVVLLGSAFLILLLSAVSALVLSNTIRLTVFGRRREIRIMKDVGAANGFIRLPVMVEGAVIGALAAGVSLLLLRLGHGWLMRRLPDLGARYVELQLLETHLRLPGLFWPGLLAGFLLLGSGLGLLGGGFFVRKYVKV